MKKKPFPRENDVKKSQKDGNALPKKNCSYSEKKAAQCLYMELYNSVFDINRNFTKKISIQKCRKKGI